MDSILDLFRGQQTTGGRLALTRAIIVAASSSDGCSRRSPPAASTDAYARYHLRKAFRAGILVLGLIAIVWRPFAGRLGLVLGLLAAGLALAMQDVIGAFASWVNILLGRIFCVAPSPVVRADYIS